MRKALSRFGGVAAGAALTSLLLPAAPAAAETSVSCDPSTSQTILSPTTILGAEDNFVRMEEQGGRRVICFQFTFLNIGAGAIVVAPVTGGTPVVVGADISPSNCPAEIFGNADFRIALDTSPATPAVCLRVGSLTKQIAFDASQLPGGPTFEVWRDGTFSEIDRDTCLLEYLAYLSGGPDTCMTTPTRVFPPA